MLLLSFIAISQNLKEVNNIIEKRLNEINSTQEEVLLVDSLNGHFFFYSTVDSVLMQRRYYGFDIYGLSSKDSSIFLNPMTQEWTYGDKFEYAYNPMHKRELETHYFSNETSNIWLEDTKELSYYDQSDTLLTYQVHEDFRHDLQVWAKDDSIVFSYNQQNLVFEEHTYDWDKDNDLYELMYRNHLGYNASNLLTSDTTFSYYNGYEEYNVLATYQYDGSGNRIQRTGYYWAGPQYGFENMEKRHYFYDQNNRLTGSMRYEWDNSNWVVIEQVQYIYNEYDLPRFMMFWEADEPGILERDFTFEFFYSYHSIVGSWETLEHPKLHIYPNPTIGELTIESDIETTCRIINSIGLVCMQVNLVPGKNKMDMSELPTGIYILINEEGNNREKIIVH